MENSNVAIHILTLNYVYTEPGGIQYHKIGIQKMLVRKNDQ